MSQDLISKWSAPSNIALVKYWGKKTGVQIPANPSVSLTLSQCKTISEIKLVKKTSKRVKVVFEGKENTDFLPKIETFLDRISEYLRFLDDYSIEIESENTFPHSSGIASSASSFASFALCLVDLEQTVSSKKIDEIEFFKKASLVSRLGSGSACRSLYGYGASWGYVNQHLGSDEYATPTELSDSCKDICDRVLIIEKGKKKVSSTVGHSLMDNHFYKDTRYKHAVSNMELVLKNLKNGDLSSMGEVIENEALTLHAMMMMSYPSFTLMAPNTLSAINKVREFRKETSINAFFTLDAGANLHLLYDKCDKKRVDEFYKSELEELCVDGFSIDDKVGEGPIKYA